jgi:hypothetical protein
VRETNWALSCRGRTSRAGTRKSKLEERQNGSDSSGKIRQTKHRNGQAKRKPKPGTSCGKQEYQAKPNREQAPDLTRQETWVQNTRWERSEARYNSRRIDEEIWDLARSCSRDPKSGARDRRTRRRAEQIQDAKIRSREQVTGDEKNEAQHRNQPETEQKNRSVNTKSNERKINSTHKL